MKKQMKKWILPCAAALFTIGASMTAFAAQGWTMEGDNWVYIDSSGNRVTDAWKKSGDNWFYLDSSGDMAKSSVIEYDDDYYYVNSVGAMVSNEWREIPSDYEEEDSPETYWYYFQNNGKAYKASSSGRPPLNRSAKPAEIGKNMRLTQKEECSSDGLARIPNESPAMTHGERACTTAATPMTALRY